MLEKKKLELEAKANEIRKLTIQMIGELGTGHIGGALSLCEVLSVLYFDTLNIDAQNAKMEDRDRFCFVKRTWRSCTVCNACIKRGFSQWRN